MRSADVNTGCRMPRATEPPKQVRCTRLNGRRRKASMLVHGKRKQTASLCVRELTSGCPDAIRLSRPRHRASTVCQSCRSLWVNHAARDNNCSLTKTKMIRSRSCKCPYPIPLSRYPGQVALYPDRVRQVNTTQGRSHSFRNLPQVNKRPDEPLRENANTLP
jgi:hypothetical protein